MPKDDRVLNVVRVGEVITYSSLSVIAKQAEESLDGM
jgi:hypothetical protein